MKILEIRKLTTEQLLLKANELRADIIDTKRRLSMGETNNSGLIRTKRRDLSRILTVLSENLSREAK